MVLQLVRKRTPARDPKRAVDPPSGCQPGIRNKADFDQPYFLGAYMRVWSLIFRACALHLCLASVPSFAEVFKMSCEVVGSIDQPEEKKFVPTKVGIEIQSIGKNIFINLTGPKLYEMRISSLSTEKFTGKNLTNADHLGVSSKSVESAQMSEIVIGREKVDLKAYKDTVYAGAPVRLQLQGPCLLP